MTSRTDALRKGGGTERRGSGGGGDGFVKWGDEYAWIEGEVVGTFETKFGLAATMAVTNTGGASLMVHGTDDNGEEFSEPVRAGSQVNIGLASATLRDTIKANDKGKKFHVAFEGWDQAKGGNRYRCFAVIELTEREAPAASDEPEPVDTRDYSDGDPDEGLPF